MKKIWFVLLLLLTATAARSQSFEIENLKKVLKEYTKADTVRVNRLNEICNANPILALDELEPYATEALQLARKLNYTKGIGWALMANARVAGSKNQRDVATVLEAQADSVAKITGDLPLQWWVKFRLSGLVGDYKERLAEAMKAEAIAAQINNPELSIRTQNRLADTYRLLGNYALALEYGLKALKAAETLNNPSVLYFVNNTLSTVYSSIGEYDKANTYLQKQPALIQQLGYSNLPLSILYNNLGENARLARRYVEALEYYNKGIGVATNLDAETVLAGNIADVYLHMDSVELAFQYVRKAVALNAVLKREDVNSGCEYILARAHLRQNQIDSALYYAKAGFKNASKHSVMEEMLRTSQTLAEAYARSNDYKNAFNYFKLYVGYRDSLQGAEVKNKTTVLAHNFEMEKKEDQIALLNQQKKTQQTFLISSLIVLALILISGVLLVRNIRQQRRANHLLQQQKQEIDEKAKELALQKESLEKAYNNVELLGQIGRKITASLSVEKIIGTVYDNVNSLMDAAVFGIGIYHDETKTLDFPATYEKGQALPPYSNSIHDQNRLAGLSFISGKEILINDLTKEYSKYLQQIPTPLQGKQAASLIYLPLKVKEKIFGVITVQSFQQNAFTDYHLNMLRTIAVYAAIALENAESFKKLNETVTHLKETQKQLIQSEKMASLGELTAGIAHEIQNPLNFVNNFSEVNTELIEELRMELTGGNKQSAEQLVNDIKSNSGKINFHGKRAADIVKSMLQHSRTSSGQKEPIDINALCDEYLRLAYHGLRAKDKSFNARFETDFDASLPKINVISQDIGRVVLNLINNAFYAVSERTNSQQQTTNNATYEPTVTVSTKNLRDKIEIRVKDNGTGIPDPVKEKIFQPFFTTKPTGHGTGLGLSLSYDIVKAHGGDLKVDSKEGDGTTFMITLPNQQ